MWRISKRPGFDDPEAMVIAVDARPFDVRRARLHRRFDELRQLPGPVAGDHEHRAELRARRLQQLQAVFLRAGHRELVRLHRALFPGLRFDCRDERPPRVPLPGLVELLLVDVEHRRLRRGRWRPSRSTRRAGAATVAVAFFAALGEFEADGVVRVLRSRARCCAGEITSYGGARRSLEGAGGRRVAEPAEGQESVASAISFGSGAAFVHRRPPNLDRASRMPPYCVFCNIVAGREPANIIYEDDEIIVIQNVLRWVPVMLLAMTKEHTTQDELWADHIGKVGEIAAEIGKQTLPRRLPAALQLRLRRHAEPGARPPAHRRRHLPRPLRRLSLRQRLPLLLRTAQDAIAGQVDQVVHPGAAERLAFGRALDFDELVLARSSRR